ncbi:MAG: methyl-accepting chemotaxis protein [Desulfuromonas sp.]|nr:methyl-accepting chemotaxis protein [Desulfuromonas sp.]
MKIKTKLLTAVWLTIVLLVIIAATGIFSTSALVKKLTAFSYWSDIDKLTSAEVTQNYLLMDTLATAFRENPTSENLSAFNSAYVYAQNGLDKWSNLVAARPAMAAIGAQLKDHLVRYQTDMTQYAQLVNKKKSLKHDCDELMESLFIDLNVAMGVQIDRGRARARSHQDFDDMRRWNRIYTAMNEQVIVNALKLQTALQDFFYARTTPSYILLTEQLAALEMGIDQWRQTFTGQAELEVTGREIFDYIAKLAGIFSAIRANDKQNFTLTDQMQQTLVQISTSVNGCMTEIVAPSKAAALTQAQQIKTHAVWVLNLIAISSIFIALIAGTLFTRNIAVPIVKTTAMINDLVRGRVTQRLKLTRRRDEIGQMAANLDDYADNIEHELIPALQAMANGDLSVSVHPVDENDQLRSALATLGHDLNSLVGEVNSASGQIKCVSAQVSDSSQGLSRGATATAASLEEISSSMQQMTAQVEQSACNAAMAKQLAAETSCETAKSSQHMAAMIEAMDEIDVAGQSIGKIIKVIDEIAFQTNLLALNAAVEAARAGQQGKGFAVVAEEVRSLAARSAKAASETAALIEGSVVITNRGSQVASDTENALGDVVKSISKVNDLVSEIAMSTQEQAEGIAQITVGLSQIDQVVQQNTLSSAESTAIAQELRNQSAQMQDLLGKFVLNQEQHAYLGQG